MNYRTLRRTGLQVLLVSLGTGGPSRLEKQSGMLVHHEVKSFESQFKVYQEVVESGAIVDNPDTAAADSSQARRGASAHSRSRL